MTPPKTPDEALELVRRASGLRLDRHGRFWLRDAPITHARTLAALHAGMAQHEATSEPIVRVGHEWAYVEVEDTLLFVVGVEGPPEAMVLRLSSGEREPLVPSALSLRGEDTLYARVRGGELRARFLSAAWQTLAAHLALDDAGGPILRLGAVSAPLARDP